MIYSIFSAIGMILSKLISKWGQKLYVKMLHADMLDYFLSKTLYFSCN